MRELDRTMWATDEGEGGATSAQPAGGQGRTFTQEQLDAIVGERATRAKGAAISELLGELGIERPDDLKALVRAAKARQDSDRTEAQKLAAQLADMQAREAKALTELQQARAQAAASKGGALYPDLVAAKIPPEALGDDKKTDEALKAIRAQYPALFGARGGSADGGAGHGATTGQSMNDWIRQAAGRR